MKLEQAIELLRKEECKQRHLATLSEMVGDVLEQVAYTEMADAIKTVLDTIGGLHHD